MSKHSSDRQTRFEMIIQDIILSSPPDTFNLDSGESKNACCLAVNLDDHRVETSLMFLFKGHGAGAQTSSPRPPTAQATIGSRPFRDDWACSYDNETVYTPCKHLTIARHPVEVEEPATARCW